MKIQAGQYVGAQYRTVPRHITVYASSVITTALLEDQPRLGLTVYSAAPPARPNVRREHG